MRYLRVRNWENFQHYNKRTPPWIKFHSSTLDNFEFAKLPDATKAHLMQIWLLASRTDNRIPYDPSWIAQKINAKSKLDIEKLVAGAWVEEFEEQDASEALASCLHKERRGEERRDRGEDSSAEPSGEDPAPVEGLITNTGELYFPSVNDYEQYLRSYPAVDVQKAFREMAGWCTGNAKRRKTKDGMGRFIASWLSKGQNEAGGPTSSTSTGNSSVINKILSSAR